MGANLRNVWTIPRKTDKQRGHIRRHDGLTDRWDARSKAEHAGTGGASLRNVWKIPTQGFPAPRTSPRFPDPSS